MKEIKNKIIIDSVLLILSAIGMVVAIVLDNSFGVGFCSSIIGAEVVWLYKLIKASKNEEKAKEYKILENDERLITLNMQARAISLSIMQILIVIVGIVGYFINNEVLLLFSVISVLVSILLYVIAYIILNKIK